MSRHLGIALRCLEAELRKEVRICQLLSLPEAESCLRY
jgi:hypothetical protein